MEKNTNEDIEVETRTENDLSGNKTKNRNGNSVSLPQLYRFSNLWDRIMLFLMFLCAMVSGLSLPISAIIFKDVVNIVVVPPTSNSTAQSSTFYADSLYPLVIKFAVIATCTFLSGALMAAFMSILSRRLNVRLRCEFLAAVTRQEAAWIDSQQTGNLVVKMSEDMETIVTATTDKIVQIVQMVTTFVSSISVAFYYDWTLSLIACTSQPLMICVFYVVIQLMRRYATKQIQASAVAGGVAEEILAALKTVVASNAQESEVERYGSYLKNVEKYGIKKAMCQGAVSGSISLILYGISGLVYRMGIYYFGLGRIDAGMVVLIFLLVVIGSLPLGACIPMVENVINAKTAAFALFEIIDRKPEIDYREPGTIPDSFDGDIELNNVTFHYPSRPHATILENFSFTIPQGKRVAFIGASGSGKSTIIQLLQRFYDPNSGSVSLGGKDLREINLEWFRSQIGVVHQEPALFSGTIADQIRLGKLDASDDEVHEAARRANAYDFIMGTSKQFDTEMSDIGSGFSGGQKQRIAIATALIGQRRLLILDEATSALDTESEKQVQETLDQNMCAAGNSVTVVMVAHRLQTVRNADIIVVMRPGGEIVEKGSHEELMLCKGMYFHMLEKQNTALVSDEDASDSEDDEEETGHADMTVIDLGEGSVDDLSSRWSIASKDTKESKNKRGIISDFLRLMKLNKPEAFYLILGFVSSVILGLITPLASLLQAQMYQVFALKYTDMDKMKEQGTIFTGLLVLPGALIFIFQILKQLGLGTSGEALTTRLRSMTMTSILNQEMAWFDSPDNQVGMLTSRLALEASLVKGTAGPQLGIFVETGTSLVAVLFICFYYSWEMALLLFIIIPCLMLTGVMQTKNTTGNTSYTTAAMKATGVMLECLNKLKVVHSLNLQQHFQNKFRTTLKSDDKNQMVGILLYSIFCGLGNCAMVLSYCMVFGLGGYLMDLGRLSMLGMMRVYSCMCMTSTAMGRAFALTPDLEKSRQATCSILNTIDRVPTIDCSTKGNGFVPTENLKGLIEFTDVKFRYPSRPKIKVLRKLCLRIEPTQDAALVGHSGCGKSTIIQMLMRFYEPSPSSHITIDGHDIRSLNVRWLRSQIGLVQQEPSLFNVSVRDNICLGASELDMGRVEAAARAANIHEFVTTLPQGYDTRVGQRGGHLSGGQKQRLCIARALYRDPALLLLDEATSALDNESEAVVQQALNAASEGRTSVTVAHRLSTVRDCDSILVLEHGRVAESGSHDQLMTLKAGIYNRLYLSSNTDN